jgi:hypothetical protein
MLPKNPQAITSLPIRTAALGGSRIMVLLVQSVCLLSMTKLGAFKLFSRNIGPRQNKGDVGLIHGRPVQAFFWREWQAAR